MLLEAKLVDGRIVSRRVDISPGHPARPLTWSELNEKFLDCAASCGIDGGVAQEVFDALRQLESVSDVATLLRTLVPLKKCQSAAAE